MGDLLDLAKQMAELRNRIATEANETAKRVALTILGDLAYKTPVDTSLAISSWIISYDAPLRIVLNPHFPGQKGSTFRASAAETIALGKVQLSRKKPGQVVFIANNQPYIRKLNEGSSTQQPAGFVERAVILGRKGAKTFKVFK